MLWFLNCEKKEVILYIECVDLYIKLLIIEYYRIGSEDVIGDNKNGYIDFVYGVYVRKVCFLCNVVNLYFFRFG